MKNKFFSILVLTLICTSAFNVFAEEDFRMPTRPKTLIIKSVTQPVEIEINEPDGSEGRYEYTTAGKRTSDIWAGDSISGEELEMPRIIKLKDKANTINIKPGFGKNEYRYRGRVHFVYNIKRRQHLRAMIYRTERFHFREETDDKKNKNMHMTLEKPLGKFFLSYDVEPNKMFFIQGEVTKGKYTTIETFIRFHAIFNSKNELDKIMINPDGRFKGTIGIKDLKKNKIISKKEIDTKFKGETEWKL